MWGQFRSVVLMVMAILLAAVSGGRDAAAQATWRSDLYPANWTAGPSFRVDPSKPDQFLHDFSYAGYHEGRDPIPSVPPGAPAVYNVKTQFGAQGDGVADDTDEIQAALEAAADGGGGTVYLPPGTYNVAPKGDDQYALWIRSNQTLLKGAGSGSTRLVNTARVMRDDGAAFGKAVIRVSPEPERAAYDDWWYSTGQGTRAITANVGHQATTVKVSSINGLGVDDWVVVRAQPNEAFIADHAMGGTWSKAKNEQGDNVLGGPVFYRKITAISGTTLTLDIPLRYRLLTSWNPTVSKVPSHIGEVGVEGLSIGMLQNTTGGTEDDYDKPGTGAYQVHSSKALLFDRVVYGWARDVKSFRPSGNAADFHILSKGIELIETRNVQIEDVYMAKPQLRGVGGNGYLMQFTNAQENLVTSSTFDRGRHNVTFDRMGASGNVVHDVTSRFARLPSDYHRYLSMSNLFDSVTFDKDYVQAANRGGSSLFAGHTTSQSVFWNTTGVNPYTPGGALIVSAQHGYGYAIGTSSAGTGFDGVKTNFNGSNPAPTDWVEGQGQGTALVPQSLYEDQKDRRLGG